MQALKPFTPTMLGGAADLVESTKTEFEGAGLFSEQHAGRNIAGIREHAMGSIVNGIGLTQGMLKPYGSTFLIFSDYMRPAVGSRRSGTCSRSGPGRTTRSASARTGRRISPSSTTRALRAIPNLWYVRPGDANETAMAWRIALEREAAGALSLSRQKLPTLDRTGSRPPRTRCAAPTRSGSRATASPTSSCSPPARGRRRLRGGAGDGRERPRRLDAVGALRRAAAGLPRQE